MEKTLQEYLAWCARRAILREDPMLIAVAGSVGKTSTKEAVATALGASEPSFGVRASAKNYNNEFGVPLTVLDRMAPGRSVFAWIATLVRATLVAFGIRKIGARTLVLEYGTDHPGDLSHLISIAAPDVAVLTAIGAEHTEFFGTVDAVADEERSLIRSLGEKGVAVLNADDPRVMAAAKETKANVITFGESPDADAHLVSYALAVDAQDFDASGLDVAVTIYGVDIRFRLRGMFGKPQALAAAAAVAVSFALDRDEHHVMARLNAHRGMAGRTRLVEGIKRTVLLDDSYNSSPLAALSAVRDLAAYPVTEGCRRIAALGDMLELGPLSDEAHRELGKAVAESGIDMLVACGTLAHVVADSAKTAGMAEDRIFVFAKSPEAGLFIQERLKQGDVVLVKGSQGARMEKITKELMAHPERAEELLVRQGGEWEKR
jgi:UDP-N-acetylmuramoyl-tripeptide--D-alanyl-D-alanine ligase